MLLMSLPAHHSRQKQKILRCTGAKGIILVILEEGGGNCYRADTRTSFHAIIRTRSKSLAPKFYPRPV